MVVVIFGNIIEYSQKREGIVVKKAKSHPEITERVLEWREID
jgi:hypothetical protein